MLHYKIKATVVKTYYNHKPDEFQSLLGCCIAMSTERLDPSDTD